MGGIFKSVGKVIKKAAPIALGVGGALFGGPAGAALGGSLGGLFGGGGGGYGGDFASGLGGMAGSLYDFYGQEKVDKGILEAQLRAAEEARAQLNPYAQAGTDATQRLSNRLAQGFQFNRGDLYNDPGYQFQFGEGERALNAQAARSGLLGSGRALKEATQYGQGMAEGQFGNVYNRNLNRWNLENAGMQNLTGTGLTAATGIGKIATDMGKNRADYRVRRGQGRNDLSSGLLDNAGPVLGGIGDYLTNLGGASRVGMAKNRQQNPLYQMGGGAFLPGQSKSNGFLKGITTRRPMTGFGRQSAAQNMRLSRGSGGSNWKVLY